MAAATVGSEARRCRRVLSDMERLELRCLEIALLDAADELRAAEEATRPPSARERPPVGLLSGLGRLFLELVRPPRPAP